MKTFEQARDVLENTIIFHNSVSELYSRLAGQTSHQRARMLLEYMSQHEKEMTVSLANYEKDASEKVLNTWFQYTLEEDYLEFISNLEIKPDLSVNDVTNLGITLDNYLEMLFLDLVEQADSLAVKEVFQNLYELEKQEKQALTRTASSMFDF